MDKQQKIIQNQNIRTAISGTIDGLGSIYNHFDGELDHDNDIDNVLIADGETPLFEDEAQWVKDYALPQAVREAHNKYVSLLSEWNIRTGNELNELLLTDKTPI